MCTTGYIYIRSTFSSSVFVTDKVQLVVLALLLLLASVVEPTPIGDASALHSAARLNNSSNRGFSSAILRLALLTRIDFSRMLHEANID